MRAKRLRNVMLVFVLAGGLAIVSDPPSRAQTGAQTAPQQTTTSKVKQDVAEAIQAIKNYSVEQRDEAVKKAKEAVDDLDARIDRVQARLDKTGKKMSQAAHQEATATLKALRKERTEVAEWYGGLKHGAAATWEEVKGGFLKSYQALQDGVSKAEREFSPPPEKQNSK
jgi:predicted  nucleic acid-binding Zn-ribbon protein